MWKEFNYEVYEYMYMQSHRNNHKVNTSMM